jgi:hypothetical protein
MIYEIVNEENNIRVGVGNKVVQEISNQNLTF